MEFLNTISHLIIKAWFDAIVYCHAKLHNMHPVKAKVKQLHLLPAGSLGKEIAICLQQHGLTLIPGYESHDMMHVLLGYSDYKYSIVQISFYSFVLRIFYIPDCVAVAFVPHAHQHNRD